MSPLHEAPDKIAQFEAAAQAASAARRHLRSVVFGQDDAIDLAICALICRGHARVQGVTGSAKTLLVEALSHYFGLKDIRLALAADTPTSEVLNALKLEHGQTALLLAEDLDTAPPRIQTTILELMDRSAFDDADGATHVFATTRSSSSNRIGLSEAQNDRFMMEIPLKMLDRHEERQVIVETARHPTRRRVSQIDPAHEHLMTAQRIAVELPVAERVVDGLLETIRRARPDDAGAPAIVKACVASGPGPRAGQALMRLIRARALIDGRPSPSLEDVRFMAGPVLRHRLTLRPHVHADADAIVKAIVSSL